MKIVSIDGRKLVEILKNSGYTCKIASLRIGKSPSYIKNAATIGRMNIHQIIAIKRLLNININEFCQSACESVMIDKYLLETTLKVKGLRVKSVSRALGYSDDYIKYAMKSSKLSRFAAIAFEDIYGVNITQEKPSLIDEETKEEPKEEQKEEPKEEPKEEQKEEPKEEPKEEQTVDDELQFIRVKDFLDFFDGLGAITMRRLHEIEEKLQKEIEEKFQKESETIKIDYDKLSLAIFYGVEFALYRNAHDWNCNRNPILEKFIKEAEERKEKNA